MNKLLSSQYTPLIIALVVAILITFAIVFFAKIYQSGKVKYSKKDAFLTAMEKRYYEVFKEIFGSAYIVLPQINLASVINKDSPGFRSELFRNVDFGVFDAQLRPILLIEINDSSHLRKDRIERDESVNLICKKAKIPLVTFWTKDGIDRDYFIQVFRRYI